MTREVEVNLEEVAPSNDELKRNAGALLRKMRVRNGWKQEQLAEKMGLRTAQAVSLIERGENAFLPKHMAALRKAGVGESELRDLDHFSNGGPQVNEGFAQALETQAAEPQPPRAPTLKPGSTGDEGGKQTPLTNGPEQTPPTDAMNKPSPVVVEGWEDFNEIFTLLREYITEVRKKARKEKWPRWKKEGFEALILRPIIEKLYVGFHPFDLVLQGGEFRARVEAIDGRNDARWRIYNDIGALESQLDVQYRQGLAKGIKEIQKRYAEPTPREDVESALMDDQEIEQLADSLIASLKK